jgi:hypothetical protein
MLFAILSSGEQAMAPQMIFLGRAQRTAEVERRIKTVGISYRLQCVTGLG